MAFDYYAATRQIIDALASEGMGSEAKELRDVIAAGSTSTEILMGHRVALAGDSSRDREQKFGNGAEDQRTPQETEGCTLVRSWTTGVESAQGRPVAC